MNPSQPYDPLNQFYIEQQQYFAQFQNHKGQYNNNYQEQLEILKQKGFTKKGKIIGLLKRFHGNVEQVIQTLENQQQDKTDRPESDSNIIENIKNTQIIMLDSNNLKYSSSKWDKYKQKPLKQIRKALKLIMLICKSEENILQQVNLVWDYLDLKILHRLSHHHHKSKKYLQEISEQLHQQTFTNQVNFLISKGDTTYLQVYITSTYPQKADDYIISILTAQDNNKTTVVTCDNLLRKRLEEIGVTQFIGGGQYWKLKEFLQPKSQNDQKIEVE